MGVTYKSIMWNRQKRIYDGIILLSILLYLLSFIVAHQFLHPEITSETLIIRATGSLAIIMLHVILMIGPLARIDSRFLVLLYNRRHLGVSMFMVALVHGIYAILQFHMLGNINPIVSIFVSNISYGSLIHFPFQVLGFFALIILFLMAATSHDFWLKNLGPRSWKALHMMVYVAYALVILHVLLGVIQLESTAVNLFLVGLGIGTISILHLVAGIKSYRLDRTRAPKDLDGMIQVCHVNDIAKNKAKIVVAGRESVAIYKYDGKLSAVSNVCKHQNGPVGEGKVIDGCITCPWHGFQYKPENGTSPPPFDEKLATYNVILKDSEVWLDPNANPEGTFVEPTKIHAV